MSKLFKKKVDFPSRLKSTATGSLSNLLECTSMETPKLIKNRRQDLNSLIFKPEFASIIPYKRNKSFVDLQAIKRDSSFAGINSEYRREDVFTRLPHKKSNFINLVSHRIKSTLTLLRTYSLMTTLLVILFTRKIRNKDLSSIITKRHSSRTNLTLMNPGF